ncbi:MAG: hypothetical protein PWQ58_1576 [Archaeoglobaceae archaeon]|nr:hypothetical protein [Archaeoglobaceae archaeon]
MRFKLPCFEVQRPVCEVDISRIEVAFIESNKFLITYVYVLLFCYVAFNIDTIPELVEVSCFLEKDVGSNLVS